MLPGGMAKRTLPSLTALRSFEAAARHHSFRRAAEELGITQSAISHQVTALEEALKVTLFRRISRGIELTEAGARVRIVLPTGSARRIFEITSLDDALPVAETRSAAIAELER